MGWVVVQEAHQSLISIRRPSSEGQKPQFVQPAARSRVEFSLDFCWLKRSGRDMLRGETYPVAQLPTGLAYSLAPRARIVTGGSMVLEKLHAALTYPLMALHGWAILDCSP